MQDHDAMDGFGRKEWEKAYVSEAAAREVRRRRQNRLVLTSTSILNVTAIRATDLTIF